MLARDGRDAVESLDRRSVFYSGPEASIWQVPASGGSPVLVARNGWGPFPSFNGSFVYYSGPDATIWRIPTGGGKPARVLKTGPRAWWALAAAGIYVLDPDAAGGPAIELFPFRTRRTQVARLPGKPDSYTTDELYASAISPDGRWTLHTHVDRSEADLMLVENFR